MLLVGMLVSTLFFEVYLVVQEGFDDGDSCPTRRVLELLHAADGVVGVDPALAVIVQTGHHVGHRGGEEPLRIQDVAHHLGARRQGHGL